MIDSRRNDTLKRRGALANLASSLVLALQSVLMLMVVSRVGSIEDAGVFTFGFANANLFLNMGRFGMRNYQASDAAGQFPFGTYLTSRFITILAMIASAVAYTLCAAMALDYGIDKIFTIILLCLFKAEDAFEDVYHGDYQRNGRLDIAGALLCLRLILSVAVFDLAMFAGFSMNESIVMSIVVGAIYIVAEIRLVRKLLDLPASMPAANDVSISGTQRLLRDCVPLFVAAFASFLTINSPKYAIDALCGDRVQAIFGYLFMPVFVINLLASAVFQPQVASLAKEWADGRYEKYVRSMLRQVYITALISAGCVLLAMLCGTQVLGGLFHINLDGYSFQLALLMCGGGLYALVILIIIGITIQRAQQGIGVIYLIVTIASLVACWLLVAEYGLFGAVLGYVSSMLIQAVVFGAYLACSLKETVWKYRE